MQPDVQHVSVLNHQLEHEFETILCYPRGISACSAEELVFISDSLHDRIIITDGSGRVLDYNHAIRRADLSSRVLDTVYPKRDERQGLVHRWLRKLGFTQNSSQMDVGRPQISFPWHLSIVPNGQIIAATQGFEKLWMIEVGTGTVTVESDQEPATNSKKLMESKAYQLEDSDVDWMHVHEMLVKKGVACEGFSNLVSQVAVLKSEVLVVDTGRSLIGVDVALPRGTVLAEPLTEDNLWRQGRGSLVELSALDGELLNQKITAAQQYMDDLHDLEGTIDKKIEDHSDHMPVLQQSSSGLPFYSSIDASLGTGEVVFDAVLYLKQDKSAGSDCIPGSPYSGDSYSRKVTMPSSRKLSDFPDGALFMMHFSFRVKCHVYADADGSEFR